MKELFDRMKLFGNIKEEIIGEGIIKDEDIGNYLR